MKIVCAGMLAVAVAAAQQPQFEVASLKPSQPVPLGSNIAINLATYRNGTFTMDNVTLSECLQFAYALPSEDQVIGPDWIKSRGTRFDVAAKTAKDTSVETVRQMLRALLVERLKVMVRMDQRPFSFAALVPAKGGVKLTEAQPGETRPGSGTAGRIVGRQMPMATLASLLSRFERQLVIDRTGLTGRYQLTLEWGADAGPNGPAREGPSLQSALEEQLGLKLESRREPLDVVVVESAERVPADN